MGGLLLAFTLRFQDFPANLLRFSFVPPPLLFFFVGKKMTEKVGSRAPGILLTYPTSSWQRTVLRDSDWKSVHFKVITPVERIAIERAGPYNFGDHGAWFDQRIQKVHPFAQLSLFKY
ncbi:hypothetical protein OIU79_015746 [Salix purpurea]|uniref:Uncharacterized protein n=1 Tax=Salix purpurea TaxID=77065 RepID=A0A9Q0SQX5_SALPP|nr:hypothetical protein OIU79_015746 [Salix purpurea]